MLTEAREGQHCRRLGCFVDARVGSPLVWLTMAVESGEFQAPEVDLHSANDNPAVLFDGVWSSEKLFETYSSRNSTPTHSNPLEVNRS